MRLLFCFLLMLVFQTLLAAESQSPWDRGVDEGKRQKAYDKDLGLIEGYYDDCEERTDYKDIECLNIAFHHIWEWGTEEHIKREEEIWPKCDGRPYKFPYRYYWMAFQKGEQVQVPFTSAFVTKEKIQEYIEKTDRLLLGMAPS